MNWLDNGRTVKKKQYDYSTFIKCIKLLFLSAVISSTPIIIQSIIELDGYEEKNIKVFVHILSGKDDFRYVNISLLFMLFCEHFLLDNNTETGKTTGKTTFIWLIFMLIFWLTVWLSKEVNLFVSNIVENGLSVVSVTCFFLTLIQCVTHIASKYLDMFN